VKHKLTLPTAPTWNRYLRSTRGLLKMPTLYDDRERLIGEITRLNLTDESDKLLFCYIFNEYFKVRQLIRENGADWFSQDLLMQGKRKRKAIG